jgi:ribonuclease HI
LAGVDRRKEKIVDLTCLLGYNRLNIEAFFDGAIIGGNPGGEPTYGFWIRDRNTQEIIVEGCGICKGTELARIKPTNNIAEWCALYQTLLALSNMKGDSVVIYGDSKLVIDQMNGRQTVSDDFLSDWSLECTKIHIAELYIKRFKEVTFRWISRKNNKYADELSRKAYTDARG